MRYFTLLLGSLLLISACKQPPNAELLKGSRWLCLDVVEIENKDSLKYPDLSAEPAPEAFVEVHTADGAYEVYSAANGENILGEGIEKARYNLEEVENKLVLTVDLYTNEGVWTSEQERIPYVVQELTETHFHAISDSTTPYGDRFYNEAKCVRKPEQ